MTDDRELLSLQRSRAHHGHPHTMYGVRGIRRVDPSFTMRDVVDAVAIGMFRVSGIDRDQWPASIYDLPLGEMDPCAVMQATMCQLEKDMGIYPNVEEIVS